MAHCRNLAELQEKENHLKKMTMDYANEHGLEEGRLPIFDGITNVELYSRAEVKILFVLKEAYEKEDNGEIGNGGWDHAAYLNDNDESIIYGVLTHDRVSKIASCILRNFSLEDYNNPTFSWDMALQDFHSVAWINVGKFPAPCVTSTSDARLNEAYNYWKPVLFRQIEAYDPDVIIFGNTFKVFHNDLEKEVALLDDQWPTHTYRDKYGRLLLDAYHPSVRPITVSEKDYIDSIIKAINTYGLRKR